MCPVRESAPLTPLLCVPAPRYPHARIIAVEASSLNFHVLQRNVAPYPNVVLLNAALWPRTAPLSLTLHPHHRRNRKSNDWAFMVTETAQVRWVAAVSTAGRPREGG